MIAWALWTLVVVSGVLPVCLGTDTELEEGPLDEFLH